MSEPSLQAEAKSRGWTRTFDPELAAEIKHRWDSHDDMLEALKAAVDEKCIGLVTGAQQYFRDNDASRRALAKIRAAIAKAEGKS